MYNKEEYKNDNYVKLPKHTLLFDKDKDTILIEECNYNYALVPTMLYISKVKFNRVNSGVSNISIKELIEWCGLKCCKYKDRTCTFDTFLTVIKFLYNKNLIKLCEPINFDNLKPNTKFNVIDNFSIGSGCRKYIKVKYSIAEYILNNSTSRTKLGMLTLWCYLEGMKNKSNKEPKLCFPSYDTIQDELNMCKDTISDYAKSLRDIKVLAYKNSGYVVTGDSVKNEHNNYSTVEALGDYYYNLANMEVDKVTKTNNKKIVEVTIEEIERLEAMYNIYDIPDNNTNYDKMEEALKEIEQQRIEEQIKIQNKSERDISMFLDEDDF